MWLQITPPNRRWRISNEAVSLGHSVISGFWALYAIIVYPKLMEDMVNYENTMAYYLVNFIFYPFLPKLMTKDVWYSRIFCLLIHYFLLYNNNLE